MNILALFNRCLFVFLIFILSVSCAARDIEFSVTSSKDRMRFNSVFSKDATYFTNKGSAQVGIYSRNPYKRTGWICCHRGEKTREFFLKDSDGKNLLLQLKWSAAENTEVPTLSVFDTEGKLMAGPLKLIKSQSQLIAVSPTKTHFVVLNRNNVSVYDPDLKIIKEYPASAELTNSEAIALSNDGSSVLVKNCGSLIYVDLNTGVEAKVKSCDVPRDRGFKLAAHETEKNRFFIADNRGMSCIINRDKGKTFKPSNSFNGVVSVYSGGAELYVLTRSSIFVFDQESFLEKGVFDLYPYYEKQFGIPRHHEYPFFFKSEFDWRERTFFLQGHLSTATFYEVSIIY